jgi:integrase
MGNRMKTNITKRKDGRYVGTVQITNRRKYFYGSTVKEVERKIISAKNNALYGVDITRTVYFQDVAKEWLESKKLNVALGSYIKYETVVRTILIPHFQRQDVSKIKTFHIESFYNKLLKEGKSASYINTVVNAPLTQILSSCVKQDILMRNPVDFATKPKMRKRQVPMWSVEETVMFLKEIDGHEDEALLNVLIYGMLRINEALALKVSDINFEQNTISVSKSLKTNEDGKIYVDLPKTDNSVRTIQVPQRVMDLIEVHIVKRTVKNKILFTTTTGSYRSSHNFRNRVVSKLRKGLRTHDLRHIGASLSLSLGAPITTVSQMLGHSNTSTTLDVYSHALPDSQKLVVQALESITK